MLDTLDGPALLRWARASVDALELHCDEINALNVFPIADSDTGTNLLSTMRAAIDAVERTTGAGASAGEVAFAMARGATTGARGNSGIILSQVIRGVAESAGDGPLTALTLRDALELATVLVRGAMSVPVEGTIVTVLDCAARAARECADTDLAGVALASAGAAAEALIRTPDQLAVLERAGAVDAGGLGLLVLLDALVAVIGAPVPERPRFIRERPLAMPEPAPVTGATVSGFEVMYLVAGTDSTAVGALRSALDELGDSVVIVSDGASDWSVHVHCADAGAAIEAGLAAGQVHGIRVENLTSDCAEPSSGMSDRAILAVVEGDGMAELFRAEGATVLRSDEPFDATALLRAIRELNNREVLVLPNGALPAHELVAVGAAAREAHRDVVLLPTSSMVQGLAALAVHDPMRIAVDDAFAMSEAASGTKWGALRIATERALTLAGTCEAGDGLGLVGHEVVVVEHDPAAAGRGLLDRVLGLGGEMVTLLVGAAAPTALVDDLVAHIARAHQGMEVVVYAGGQRDDLLQLGVE